MQSPRPAAGTVFEIQWNGEAWRAIELDGQIRLTRICRYCTETTARVHTRHTVEATTSWSKIEERDARVLRLRDIGETEDADRIEKLAGRVL